ncbi:serine/threonine-protein kinase 16-like [Mya arenaria]|uniref:serine/threonine-protein kinase 16-like n=1 Tax=Mya arenaria TaxID=6604 RepID=UPI0022E2D705|nr:serine/threonine-protein kinase 16-like [Mya arenaria]XP_052798762.1 serine/threonine-protein kinase 16-like [Mya arenaria]
MDVFTLLDSLGFGAIYKMGCMCGKEIVNVNNRRFYVRSRLGDGGFSVVDLLEEARTRQLFAMKRITCHGKMDERIAMREIEVMRAFKHKHLVPLEEYTTVTIGHHEQSQDAITEVMLVMPYYKRGTIQERLDALNRKGERMKEDDIWRLFSGITKGVKEMHAHDPSYAHRDIKPGNVMIDDEGEAVLMDLGSAAPARVEIKTRSEAQALQDDAAERCSMLYRPPELFNVEPGTNIDERTDIWSLGCLLYAMAFGESPFEKAYQRGDSIALAVLSQNITFPQNSFSCAVEECVRLCLVINPMERVFIDKVITKILLVTGEV